jgi:S-adenosylmethionine hydrolase
MLIFYPIMPAKYKPRIVTLTSDFGLCDAYVAAMKAQVLRYCPRAVLIDVTHNVPPQDVLCGSITLERAIDGFGPGTVHLAVVDPGVGTSRRLLIGKIRQSLVVCPDNGLITWSWRRLGGGKVRELSWRPADRQTLSTTFHGRDIMAPVAGMLADGAPPEELSRPIDDPLMLDIAPAEPPARAGRIIHIDHFGNATTNIARESLRSVARLTVRVARRRIGRFKRTYFDAAPGAPLALFGSSGLVEIAVRDGSAAQKLGLRVGDPVVLQ